MRPGAGAGTDADTAQTSKAGPRNLRIEDAAHASEGSVEVAQTCMQARGHQRTQKPKSSPLTARPLPHPQAIEREKKMASLGLSSLLPRHNGAGAPLVSPSVPVVWLQRKKQGILSHDRPLLRCGARSVMLSHSRASKMSAYVRSSCCPSCTVRVRGGPVNLSERTAATASVRPPARVLLRRASTRSWMLILRRISHAHACLLRAGDAGNGHSSFAGHMEPWNLARMPIYFRASYWRLCTHTHGV